LRLAADLVNNHTFPGDPKIIAERYGWIAVAINPVAGPQPRPARGHRARRLTRRAIAPPCACKCLV
jgi:hypothetical protein